MNLQPAGPAILYIIFVYIIPCILYFANMFFLQSSENKTIHLIGDFLCILISLSFCIVGYYIFVDERLIITGLAGFAFGGMGIYLMLETNSGKESSLETSVDYQEMDVEPVNEELLIENMNAEIQMVGENDSANEKDEKKPDLQGSKMTRLVGFIMINIVFIVFLLCLSYAVYNIFFVK